MGKITNKADYTKGFPPKTDTNSKQFVKRLNCIFNIRKFEIALNWKRATSFWTFIAAAFAGYGISISSKNFQIMTLI